MVKNLSNCTDIKQNDTFFLSTVIFYNVRTGICKYVYMLNKMDKQEPDRSPIAFLYYYNIILSKIIDIINIIL